MTKVNHPSSPRQCTHALVSMLDSTSELWTHCIFKAALLPSSSGMCCMWLEAACRHGEQLFSRWLPVFPFCCLDPSIWGDTVNPITCHCSGSHLDGILVSSKPESALFSDPHSIRQLLCLLLLWMCHQLTKSTNLALSKVFLIFVGIGIGACFYACWQLGEMTWTFVMSLLNLNVHIVTANNWFSS